MGRLSFNNMKTIENEDRRQDITSEDVIKEGRMEATKRGKVKENNRPK